MKNNIRKEFSNSKIKQHKGDTTPSNRSSNHYSAYAKCTFRDIFQDYTYFAPSADISSDISYAGVEDRMPYLSNRSPETNAVLDSDVNSFFNTPGRRATTGICVGITSAWIIAFSNHNKEAKSFKPGVFTHFFQNQLRFSGVYFHYNYGTIDPRTGKKRFEPGSYMDMISDATHDYSCITKISSKEVANATFGGNDIPDEQTWVGSITTGDHIVGIAMDKDGYYIMDPHYGLFFYEHRENSVDFNWDLVRLRKTLAMNERKAYFKRDPALIYHEESQISFFRVSDLSDVKQLLGDIVDPDETDPFAPAILFAPVKPSRIPKKTSKINKNGCLSFICKPWKS